MIDLQANITDRGASICHIRFWRLVEEHQLTAWCEMGWPCDLGELPEELRTDASEWSGGCQLGIGRKVLPEQGSVVVRSRLSNGIVEVLAAGATKEASGQAVG